MRINQDIPIYELRKLFYYDSSNGELIRKKAVKHSQHKPGSVAGCLNKTGYRRVCIGKKLYREHRVIWAIVNGYWPESMLDHIDGDRSNNRIENLRECTQKQNCQNRIAPKKNKYVGCSYRKDVMKWQARIYVNGRNKSLGYFKSQEAAHIAYLEAREKYFDFCPEVPKR